VYGTWNPSEKIFRTPLFVAHLAYSYVCAGKTETGKP
jgi:hypothetical protein